MILINDRGDHVRIEPWYDEHDDWATQAIRDKLDELYGRIADLESDVDYYKYELARAPW